MYKRNSLEIYRDEGGNLMAYAEINFSLKKQVSREHRKSVRKRIAQVGTYLEGYKGGGMRFKLKKNKLSGFKFLLKLRTPIQDVNDCFPRFEKIINLESLENLILKK